MPEETLQALIRYLPPIIRLRKDLEMSVRLEIFDGLGDAAVKSYNGLQASIARFSNDPYLEAISLDVPSDADDKTKVNMVALAAGQLMAYIQGQLGLSVEGDQPGHIHIQFYTAPYIDIQHIGEDAVKDTMDVVRRALGNDEDEVVIEDT